MPPGALRTLEIIAQRRPVPARLAFQISMRKRVPALASGTMAIDGRVAADREGGIPEMRRRRCEGATAAALAGGRSRAARRPPRLPHWLRARRPSPLLRAWYPPFRQCACLPQIDARSVLGRSPRIHGEFTIGSRPVEVASRYWSGQMAAAATWATTSRRGERPRRSVNSAGNWRRRA